ncbi:MAG: RNA polymerase sporulation sigma factor SigK [Clostridia bacterium]|nr:RNA polymerase sporulation sigma factor SigK [Clostridia bacterium]MBR3955295.1 RNA polymerase sporulation sigma factor SigK [Clostridia bacterium]
MIENILSLLFSKLVFLALHIDNPGIFPPALKAVEEEKLLQQMQDGNENARKKLIEHNLRLVVHVIKKYYAADCEQDDLISIGTLGLIKAVNTFQSDKGVRLATYAARCIENEILMYFRSQKKSQHDISLDEPIETDSEGNPLTLMDILYTDDTIFEDINRKTECRKVRRFVEEIEDEREKMILTLRYGLNGNDPMTQIEVGNLLGISRSYVSRIETKCLKKLKKRLSNE